MDEKRRDRNDVVKDAVERKGATLVAWDKVAKERWDTELSGTGMQKK